VLANSKRSPDGAQRNPGFVVLANSKRSPDGAQRNPGFVVLANSYGGSAFNSPEQGVR
jgi:hypothetical protein